MKKIKTAILFATLLSTTNCIDQVNNGLTPFPQFYSKYKLKKEIIYEFVDIRSYEPTREIRTNMARSLKELVATNQKIQQKYKRFASIEIILPNNIWWNYKPVFEDIGKEIGADYLLYITEANPCISKYRPEYREEMFINFCEKNDDKVFYIAIFYVKPDRISIEEKEEGRRK